MSTPELLYNCFLFQQQAIEDGRLMQSNVQLAERLKKEGVPLEWFVDFCAAPYKPYIIPAVPFSPAPTKKRK